jgi:hypothetical protein
MNISKSRAIVCGDEQEMFTLLISGVNYEGHVCRLEALILQARAGIMEIKVSNQKDHKYFQTVTFDLVVRKVITQAVSGKYCFQSLPQGKYFRKETRDIPNNCEALVLFPPHRSRACLTS